MTAVRRGRELARMRALATGLLLLLAALFVVSAVLARRWDGWGYVRAFAEAGMVGACADWFAVTALFHRPLGLPIPHTAIVPRRKDAIGRALGVFVAEEFLSDAVLRDRLRRLEVARWGGGLLARPAVARRLARRLASAAPEVIDSLPPGALGAAAASAVRALVEHVPAAPAASRALALAWSGGRAQELLGWAIDRAHELLERHEDGVVSSVSARTWRWTPGWVDRAIARRITSGLIELLAELRDPQHPWRVGLDARVQGWVERLASDPDLRARGEAVKARLLADPRVASSLQAFGADLEQALLVPHGRELDTAALARGAERLICGVGGWLRDDAAVQELLNGWARALVRNVLAPRRAEIGRAIAEIVASWDAESVVVKLEAQVGRDLQYIRINGAVVGGLVGLAIYAVGRWLRLV